MAKLSKDEQKSIEMRQNLINSKRIELGLLEREQNIFIKELLENKGLDSNKKFTIGNDGALLEEAKSKKDETKKK